jgi:hypothetical protein
VNASADNPANPYAAPRAELQPNSPSMPTGTAAFYAMSPRKALVMSVLTMGFYDLCFWWRHWRARREHGHEVSVFWRTFFAGFWAFDFKSSVSLALIERSLTPPALLTAAPGIYLGSFILDNVLSRLGFAGLGFVASALCVLVRGGMLAVLQTSVNEVLKADDYRGPYNRGARPATIAIAIAGLLIWILGLVSAVNGWGRGSS